MATIRLRRGTAAQWTAANPILSQGEIGFETDTNKFKFGDGVTSWTTLTYFINEKLTRQELGFASRVAPSWTTTNTVAGDTTGSVPGLTVTFTATDRPVELEAYIPNIKHSVDGAGVMGAITVNGNVASNGSQSAIVKTNLTDGSHLYIKNRAVLTAGTTYTIGLNVSGRAAGTTTLAAAGFAPIWLAASNR